MRLVLRLASLYVSRFLLPHYSPRTRQYNLSFVDIEQPNIRIMGVIILDGSTVRAFVEDEAKFNKSVDAQFAALDLNSDGVFSCSELRKGFESFRLVEVATAPEELTLLYDFIFEKFDYDHSGTIDLDEFRSEMKKIMLAVADGLGECPIQMVLEDDDQGLLKKVADIEASKFD